MEEVFPVPAPKQKRPRAEEPAVVPSLPAPDAPAAAARRPYRVREEDTPSHPGVSAATLSAQAARLGGVGGGIVVGSTAADGPGWDTRGRSVSVRREVLHAQWARGGGGAPASDFEAEWNRVEAATASLPRSLPPPGSDTSASRRSRFGPSLDTPSAAHALAAVVAGITPSLTRGGGGHLAPPADDPVDFDREYYDAAEGGGGASGGGRFLGDPLKFAAREEAWARARVRGEVKIPRMSAKKSAMIADQEAWEVNRLRTSGAGGGGGGGAAWVGGAEEEEQVHLIVHNRKPPFLEAREGGGAALSALPGGLGGGYSGVPTVKDPSSDIAQLARRGSELVRKCREKRDRARMREKFWELGGTKMGDVVGVKGDGGATAAGEQATDAEKAERAMGAALGGGGGGSHSSRFSDAPVRAEAASDFSREKTLAQQRAFLPVYHVRGELLDVVAANQVVVVVGETGSGKTTQLAQYLYEEGYSQGGKLMIGCTQPRRVAAMSVAQRVAAEVGCEVGSTVGYAIRFEDVTSPSTVIKFMTDGVLLRETLRDVDLDAYAAVIMDEAHERSLNTDVLFGILRGVVARRRDFRLIVTSATMDSAKFAAFFGGVPTFRIPGRTFPVTKHYGKSVPEDYVDAAVRAALTIHLSNPAGSGDILVFMTGQEDIEATCETLVERASAMTNVPPLLVLPMYSQLPADLQARIFERAASGARKIIVSTNIAETSLTLDGVAFVVDPGLVKTNVYNPRIGMDVLTVLPVSQASAEQRAGRAGRTGPGHAHRCYPEGAFKRDLLPSQVPEIQRTNLGTVVLLLKSLGVRDVRAFPFMDAPPADNLAASEHALWVLGALDDGGALTDVGRRMVDFPLDPPLAKMLHTAAALGCVKEVAVIVSMLTVSSPFFRPRDREAEADAVREKFFVPESDHLTMLNVYTQWQRNGGAAGGGAAWCSAHFIHLKVLKKAEEVLGQLLDIMRQHRIPASSAGEDWDAVRRAVCSGYFYNAARLKGVGEYVNLLNGLPCTLHPSSSLFGLGYTPPYVVYHELTLTTKEYMSCVTSVEPQWLAELGPAFFGVRGAAGGGGGGSRLEAFSEVAAQAARRAYETAPTPALSGGCGGGTACAPPTPVVSEGRVSTQNRSQSSVRAGSGPATGTLAERIAAAKAAQAAKTGAK